MSKMTYILGGLAAAAIVAGGAFVSQRGATTETALATTIASSAEAATAELLPDYVLGQEDAPITVIEYASYTCPHCADFHKDVLSKLKRDYVDSGKVKFIHREVYFDKFGVWAGQIAQCGGAPRYYAISGMIYDTQSEWIGDGQQTTIADNLRKLGLKAGLGKDQIEACLNDQEMVQRMITTYQTNAGADDINATPTLVIDGQKYSNMSYEELKAILDAKL